jgi:hypothetical protein
MEYIDNSIDSAEKFFTNDIDQYLKPIEIVIKISGEKFRDGKVTISDNCFGITNFGKVVESIGNSDKKADFTTNGQFGYGIYSYMAACEKLEITSKLDDQEKAQYLPIERKQFDTDRQENVKIPDPKIVNFKMQSGTMISLSGFEKHSWKEINAEELKNEIEKHFELLLARKNLFVKVIDAKMNEHICKPYNYSQHEGEVYDDNINSVCYKKGIISPTTVKFNLKKPIHIYLKLTKGKSINKPPIFVAKGRRVGEIKDVRSFKSTHKSDLWAHPNITGYIDLNDFLDPTIARNDFKNTDKSKALFATVNKLEEIILDEIIRANKEAEERHYKELEDRLNQILSKLARIDAMNYRTAFLTGNNINLQQGGTGQIIEGKRGSKDRGGDPTNENNDHPLGENEGFGKGIGGSKGNIPGGENGDNASNKEADNPFEDTGFKGGEKKKSGFNIRIVDSDPDIDQETNKPIRSLLVGDEIRIFKKHPDFEERVGESRKKEKRITERLVTYIAGEITVHYKDKYFTRYGQPDYNKKMFSDLVEFIYSIETSLADLVGRNLSDY